MIATTHDSFQIQPRLTGLEHTPAASVAPWVARGIEAIGWAIYLGALGVLGSFALILCAAVMRG